MDTFVSSFTGVVNLTIGFYFASEAAIHAVNVLKSAGKDSPDSRRADCGCSTQPTEWKRIGNLNEAAMIFARGGLHKGVASGSLCRDSVGCIPLEALYQLS